MKTNAKYTPSFKFQVVLEALKAEGRGAEAKIARAYGVHPVTLAGYGVCELPLAETGSD